MSALCFRVLVFAITFFPAPCAARPQPASSCLLNADGLQEPNEGPTDYSFLIRPAGRLRAVMLFIDFPDAPHSEAPSDLYNRMVPPAQTWLKEVSYGHVSMEVSAINQWYRMSKPSDDYGFSKAIPSLTFEQHRAYVAEAVRLASAEVDFAQFQIVLVVASKGSQIPVSPTFHARIGEGIAVNGGEVRHAITFGADIRATLPHHARNVFVHEMGHLMGLPDLYDYEGSRKLQWKYVGAWDNMSSILVGAHFLAYHKLKLGGWMSAR
jgi:M6 family metalloprotease-like protein